MTRVGVHFLPIKLILLLAALPLLVRCQVNLNVQCNSTAPSSSLCPDNSTCQEDVCVCIDGFYPELVAQTECVALKSLQVTAAEETSTNVSLSWTGVESNALVVFHVSVSPLSTNHSPVVLTTRNTSVSVPGLEAGHLYRAIVVAVYNASFPISENATTLILLPPTLPGGWRHSPLGTSSVELSWNASSSSDARLLISGPGGTVEVAVSAGNATVAGLSPGANSSLSIAAVVRRSSLNATSAARTEFVLTLPAAPKSLEFRNVTAGNFTAVITAGEGTVETYRYSRSAPDPDTWTGPATKRSFGGLSPFTTYQVTVEALSHGLASTAVSDNVTTAESVPSAPQNLSLSATEDGLLLSWLPPARPNGVLTGYAVEWRRSVVSPQERRLDVGTNTSVSLGAAETPPGSRHCLRVRANTSAGPGEWSAEKCRRLPDSNASKPSLRVAGVETGSANFSWAPPNSPNGSILCYILATRRRDVYSGAPLSSCVDVAEAPANGANCSTLAGDARTRLEARLAALCGAGEAVVWRETDAFSATVDGLQTATPYRAVAFAVNLAGPGDADGVDFLTLAGRSSEVAQLTVTKVAARAFSVRVRPPAQPRGLVLLYLVTVTGDGGVACLLSRCRNCSGRVDFRNLTAPAAAAVAGLQRGCGGSRESEFPEGADAVELSAGPLRPFTVYTVAAWPVNSLGPGAAVQKNQSTLSAPPGPVLRLAVQNATREQPRRLTVRWEAPAAPNGVLTGFFVQFGRDKTVRVAAAYTSLSVLLPACAEFSVRVTAENDQGNGSTAGPVRGLTRAAVPSPPAMPQLRAVSESELDATWTRVLVPRCAVQYAASIDGAATSNLTADTRLLFDGLTPHASYRAQVRARAGPDRFGDVSAWSEWSEQSPPEQTHEGRPERVARLRCRQSRDRYIRLSCAWEEPARRHGRILGYRVAVAENGVRKSDTSVTQRNFTYQVAVLASNKTVLVSVWARTSAGFGPPEMARVLMVPGPPLPLLPIHEVVRRLRAMNRDPKRVLTTQIGLHVPCPVFSDANGRILTRAVVVCVEGRCPGLASNATSALQPARTFSETSGGRTGAYEVAYDCQTTERRRRRRQATHTVLVLIGEEMCGQLPCRNGALTPDTAYQLGLRASTAGQSRTLGFVVITTQAETDWALIGGLIFLTLLIAAATVGAMLFLLRRRRRRQKRRPDHRGEPSSRNSILGDERPETICMITVSAASLARQAASGVETAVPIDLFPAFVQEMSRDCRLLYTDAFNEVKKRALSHEHEQGLRTEEAALQSNRLKNRFANILPFDHSRVCLSADDDPNSGMDYINANYISGHRRRREFIACQGPLSQTIDDFWRMIWEQHASLIVMLTLCVERGRNKCEQYWPQEDETRVYGDIAVRLHSQSIMTAFAVRVLDLACGTESRRVTHIQMLTWEDFSAPNPEHLAGLMDAFRGQLPMPGSKGAEAATVVHCSAGVGRTGTFIALDRLINAVDAGNEALDVNGVILSMRAQRRYMVQSEAQYIFIHDFLLHYLRQHRRVKDLPATPPVLVRNGNAVMETAFANNGFRID